MPNPFPPGGIPFDDSGRPRCLWREDNTLSWLLQQALLPGPSVEATLRDWSAISRDLRDPPRRRKCQSADIKLF